MNTGPTEPKKKRDIRSFEADPDVGRLLEAARHDCLKISQLCNEALRQSGAKIIRTELEKLGRLAGKWAEVERAGLAAGGTANYATPVYPTDAAVVHAARQAAASLGQKPAVAAPSDPASAPSSAGRKRKNSPQSPRVPAPK